MSIRPVKRLIKSKPTMEGAGVHLRRAFGFGNTKEFDADAHPNVTPVDPRSIRTTGISAPGPAFATLEAFNLPRCGNST